MTADEMLAYCLGKPGAVETYPFDERTMAAKVGGKIFAMLGAGAISLKCGDEAAEWRARYPDAIRVAAYVGRYGWNSVDLDGGVPDDELRELVDSSYRMTVAKLPRRARPPGWEG
jgi:predicted DNA-binding protein (MmcQ/YjbR family)